MAGRVRRRGRRAAVVTALGLLAMAPAAGCGSPGAVVADLSRVSDVAARTGEPGSATTPVGTPGASAAGTPSRRGEPDPRASAAEPTPPSSTAPTAPPDRTFTVSFAGDVNFAE